MYTSINSTKEDCSPCSIGPSQVSFTNRSAFQPEAHWITDIEPIRAIFDDELMTAEAAKEISTQSIPDMRPICRALYGTFLDGMGPFSALQFVPVFKKLDGMNHTGVQQLLDHPKTNHVLVKNEFLKVVLIHWKPGSTSKIHGHPSGGCVFKVLAGKLEEKRFSPDSLQTHLATSEVHTGSIAYIDDDLAYHAVGNPFNESAISIHAYTPGQ